MVVRRPQVSGMWALLIYAIFKKLTINCLFALKFLIVVRQIYGILVEYTIRRYADGNSEITYR